MIKSSNTEFIFYKKNPNHLEFKKKILKQISEDIGRLNHSSEKFRSYYEENKSYTSFFHHSESMVEYSDFCKDFIFPTLDEMIDECELCGPDQSVVSKIWYNAYEVGGKHSIHSHPSCSISGIYILELGGEKNNTVFYPNYYNSSYFANEFTTEDIEEGNIILFPSHLLHEVLPCKKPKVSISFNIRSTFFP